MYKLHAPVFERWFEAPRERVWRALTDPDELAGWLAPAEIDMRVGGSVVLRFEDGDERGTITELREPRRSSTRGMREKPIHSFASSSSRTRAEPV